MIQPPPLNQQPVSPQAPPPEVKKKSPTCLIVLLILIVLALIVIVPIALGIAFFFNAASRQVELATLTMQQATVTSSQSAFEERTSLGVFMFQPHEKRRFRLESQVDQTIGFKVLEGTPDDMSADGVRISDVEGTMSVESTAAGRIGFEPEDGVIEAVVANMRDNVVRVEVWHMISE